MPWSGTTDSTLTWSAETSTFAAPTSAAAPPSRQTQRFTALTYWSEDTYGSVQLAFRVRTPADWWVQTLDPVALVASALTVARNS